MRRWGFWRDVRGIEGKRAFFLAFSYGDCGVWLVGLGGRRRDRGRFPKFIVDCGWNGKSWVGEMRRGRSLCKNYVASEAVIYTFSAFKLL